MFDEALIIREALVNEYPGNDVYQSNWSSNYVDLARVAEAEERFDEAERDLQTVIQRETALAKKDAGNAEWRDFQQTFRDRQSRPLAHAIPFGVCSVGRRRYS